MTNFFSMTIFVVACDRMEIMPPDSYSAVLHPVKVQDSEKNTGSRAAREEAKFEQVSLVLVEAPFTSIVYKALCINIIL